MKHGWYSDIDVEVVDGYKWQPCLQVKAGITLSIETWFATEEECDAFIRDHIIGEVMFE